MAPECALDTAIRLAHGQTKLAEIIGKPVTQAHVWNWLRRDGGRVPPERVIAVSAAVGFQVRPHDLRPDIYPNPTDGLPPELAA